MTVRDLIEILEQYPQDCHVVADDAEITEVVIRDEVYYTEDNIYDEGLIVKLY